MYKEIRITSMDQLPALTADQPFDSRNKRYRGLPVYSFMLKTSLQRNCGKLSNMLEPKILVNFSKYTATEPEIETDTVWKRMILGQYYV